MLLMKSDLAKPICGAEEEESHETAFSLTAGFFGVDELLTFDMTNYEVSPK